MWPEAAPLIGSERRRLHGDSTYCVLGLLGGMLKAGGALRADLCMVVSAFVTATVRPVFFTWYLHE